MEDDIQDDDYSDLEAMDVEQILREGKKALFVQLVGKVRSGKASHQEQAILRNVLKDNGMTLGIPPEQPASRTPAPVDLPEFGEPEYNMH